MIEYLPSGRDVRFATPGASGGYAEYMRVQLHAIAAGMGLTYELLTGDLSQVNYSSIRAGLIELPTPPIPAIAASSPKSTGCRICSTLTRSAAR
jgi:hypothetical protein